MRIWVRSGAECIVGRETDIFFYIIYIREANEGKENERKISRLQTLPANRAVMLVSDFQGPAVEPRTPLELRCFAV